MVSGFVMMFGVGESTAQIVAGAIVTIGGSVGYMIAEGVIDAKRITLIMDEVIDTIDALSDEQEG
jgi:hypothetical protein